MKMVRQQNTLAVKQTIYTNAGISGMYVLRGIITVF